MSHLYCSDWWRNRRLISSFSSMKQLSPRIRLGVSLLVHPIVPPKGTQIFFWCSFYQRCESLLVMHIHYNHDCIKLLNSLDFNV